jgi:hypothetical protein
MTTAKVTTVSGRERRPYLTCLLTVTGCSTPDGNGSWSLSSSAWLALFSNVGWGLDQQACAPL